MSSGYTGFALRFISGKYQGNEYPLKSNTEIVLGRGSDLEIVLLEDMVSRHHSKIITGSDYVVIQDLGSTNGTFVNGERIRKVRLQENDRILIGTSILKLVRSEGGASSFPKPPPPKPPGKKRLPAPARAGKSRSPVALLGSGAPSSDSMKPPVETKQVAAFNAPPSSSNLNVTPPPLPQAAAGVPHQEMMPSSPAISSFEHQEYAEMEAPDLGQPVMDGSLVDTPLNELLELFVNSQRNGVLLIHDEQEGRLHLRNGRLVYAIVDNDPSLAPLRAAQRILGWQRGTFELYPPHDASIQQEIDEDLLFLLREAKRLRSEIQRYKADIPPGVQHIVIERPLLSPLRDLRPNHLDILQLVHNYGSYRAVLNKTSFGDPETYQLLAFLFKNKYIKAI